MGFAHHSYNCDATSSSNWFSFQQWNQFSFVVFRDCTDDFDKLGGFGDFIFSRSFADEGMQMKLCSLLIVFNEDGNNL